MQCSSRVSAFRRELNSHDAAKPRTASYPQQRALQRTFVECGRTKRHGISFIRQSKNIAVITGAVQNNRTTVTRSPCATPSHLTAPETLVFSQFVGPPQPALARQPSVIRRGGLNARPATVSNAEREAPGAGHEEQPGFGRRSIGAHRAQRCLTPRSRRGPTAGHQARSGGTRYIFASPGLASCRRRPLSSNVRPHRKTPREPSARFGIRAR